MRIITSRDNALLKRLRALLTSSAARREQARTVLDGPHLLAAYMDRFGAEGVDIVVDAARAEHPEIAALIARAPAAVHTVTDALLKSVSPSEHPSGIVAGVPIPSPAGMDEDGRDDKEDALLLDGIQDPGNVGALLRTACAAGFRRIFLSRGCADVWSPKCLRGGMGAQFHLHVQEQADLASVLARFEGSSLACDAHAVDSLYDLSLRAPLAVVMGAEGAGVSPELLAATTHRCRIPMRTGIESLNVGAAAAVVMYEWVRRRALRVE